MSDPTSALRAKRRRDRLKNGTILAHVEIPCSLAEGMIRMGLMQDPDLAEGHVSGPAIVKRRGEALIQYIRALSQKVRTQ